MIRRKGKELGRGRVGWEGRGKDCRVECGRWMVEGEGEKPRPALALLQRGTRVSSSARVPQHTRRQGDCTCPLPWPAGYLSHRRMSIPCLSVLSA